MNDILKSISNDPDGLLTYEFMANNIETIEDQMPALVENMIRVDAHGQFSVSAARYLHAIDAGKYSAEIDRLISAAIDKDRERVYRLSPDRHLGSRLYGQGFRTCRR